MQFLLRVLIPIVILVAGWIGYKQLSVPEEKGKRAAPEGRVLKTQVHELRRHDFETSVKTQGVVRALNEATLTADVGGKVQTIAPGLEDGAFFKQDDVLLRLEPDDFEADVATAEAQLARASALFSQEEAKANQARLNWEDLGYEEEPNELVLRLPQLREAEANVKAATAALDRARRDLERASVRAPFNGRVLMRTVSVGQSVSPGTPLASIYTTDYAEVRLPIAATELAFLTIPESRDESPVDVELRDSLNEESETEWHGEIVGTEGALDMESRELFAIARIADPFSLALKPDERRPPLRIGQPVGAIIKGKILENVMVVPRSAVRQLDRIYLVDEKEMILTRHEIVPIWSDKEILVIRDAEIPDGALLATTRLAYAPNITRVEILPPTEPDPTGADDLNPKPAEDS